MGQNITQQLEQAYARATMRETARHLRGGEDWQRIRDIQTHSAQAKQQEQQSFRQEFPARLADARDAILNERAAWHYTHPTPQSAARQDRFNKDQIERQAHLRVHNAHAQTMAKIDVQENREVQQLMQKHQPTSWLQLQAQSARTAVPPQQIKRER